MFKCLKSKVLNRAEKLKGKKEKAKLKDTVHETKIKN